MSGNWQPYREDHAIEVVGAGISFAEFLTDTLLRKALRVADAVSNKANLLQRDSIAGIQLNLQPGASPRVEQGVTTGVSFKRMGIEQMPGGGVTSVAADELAVDRQNVVFRSHRYERWAQFHATFLDLVPPIVNVLLGSTTVQSIRLEYRDRFIYEGEPAAARVDQLLRRGSPLIAPHVFDEEGLWHSHTGMFLPSEGVERRLVQIAIDANDVQQGASAQAKRSVSIMTAVQDNFHVGRLEAEDQPVDMIISRLPGLHDHSKTLLYSMITDEMAKRIGLRVGNGKS